MKDLIMQYIIAPNGDIHDKINKGAEYKRISDEAFETYSKLKAILNDEQKKQLDKFADEQLGQECEASETYFKEGMKFGIRLLFECLQD